LSSASAKAGAMARPMPRLPPVTSTERLKTGPSFLRFCDLSALPLFAFSSRLCSRVLHAQVRKAAGLSVRSYTGVLPIRESSSDRGVYGLLWDPYRFRGAATSGGGLPVSRHE
jgi:hypothetical protein